MRKSFAVLICSAAALCAQSAAPAPAADPLSSLQKTAEKTSADWETPASGMEAKLGRMLPCDPRVRSTIDDVRRASEARLMAMAQYVKAAVALAVGDTEAARAAASNQEDGTKSLETESAEAEQERVAVEGQLADLADSARKVPALDPAQKRLTEIAMMIRERAQRTRQLADNKNTLTVPLQNLLAAYEARQTALENEQTALAVEAARWSEYYSARLARAQTECSIINQPGRRRK